MLDTRYVNEFGLINAKLADINAENSPLWTLQYLLIKEGDESFRKAMDKYIDMCRTGVDGLYHQAPILYGNKDDAMSPDQLLAFMCFDYKYCNNKRTEAIFKYWWQHLGTYDNLSGRTNFKCFMQPLIAFLMPILGRSFLGVITMPLLCLTLMYSCWASPSETSGKLKAWTIMKTLNMSLTHFVCDLIIKYRSDFKDWTGIFCEYFKEERNPVREAAIDRDITL